MERPLIVDRFACDGAFSHYALIDADSGDLLWSEEPEEELQQVKNNVDLGSVSNTLVADIRNKLNPINNLCAILRDAPRNLTDDEDINNIIFSEVAQCEKSIEYLSNL